MLELNWPCDSVRHVQCEKNVFPWRFCDVPLYRCVGKTVSLEHETFSPFLRGFSKFRRFHSEVFTTTLRFCAFLGWMETQLLTHTLDTQRATGQMCVSRGVEGHCYCPLGGLETIIPLSPAVRGWLDGSNELQSHRTDGVQPDAPTAYEGWMNSTESMRSLVGFPASGWRHFLGGVTSSKFFFFFVSVHFFLLCCATARRHDGLGGGLLLSHGGAGGRAGRLLPAGPLRPGAGHQRLVPPAAAGPAAAAAHLHLPVPAVPRPSQQHALKAPAAGPFDWIALFCGRFLLIGRTAGCWWCRVVTGRPLEDLY